MNKKALLGLGLGLGLGYLAFTPRGRSFVAYSINQSIKEFNPLINNKKQIKTLKNNNNYEKNKDKEGDNLDGLVT